MPSRSFHCEYPKNTQQDGSQEIYFKIPIIEPVDEATSYIGSLTLQ